MTPSSFSQALPLLEARDVSVSFGENTVLREVSVALNKGESVVLLGRSGSGKSVLLKVLLGLLEPQAGGVWADDKPLQSSGDFERVCGRVGMLFQNSALFDSFNVRENVGFALQRRVSASAAAPMLSPVALRARIDEALEQVALDPAATGALYPSDLSGGMRKRVALARAIVSDPDMLFFDEPTTGLDPITSLAINDLIRRIGKDKASLTITHDLGSMRQIADRVLFLHAGEVVVDVPVAAVDSFGAVAPTGDDLVVVGADRMLGQRNVVARETVVAGQAAFRTFLSYVGAA